MLLKTIILLLLLLLAIVNATTELYCVRYSAFERNNHEIDTCFSSKTAPIAAAAAAANTANTNQSSSTTSTNEKGELTFDLNCNANNDICTGVKATLTKAANMISSVFQFESTIHMNVTFINFCQAYNDCHYDNKMVSIGQAYPTISYIMVDNTDNMTRLYPQALLKQYTALPVKPNWIQYDIEAQFNSEVNWYFANEDEAIRSDQTDFLKNCIHEIMHGLGFMVSWGDTFYSNIEPLFDNNILSKFITPYLLASTQLDDSMSNYNTNQPFWGFVEFPLDKYIYYTTNTNDVSSAQPLSGVTRKLNEFQDSNALFKSLTDLANAWYSSSEYSLAAEMYTRATTDADFLAMVNNDPILWLESSLNPFSSGSSLCHVSQKYTNTSEYLMLYTAIPGQSVSQLDQLYPQGPLGEGLLKMMATLGYRINSTTVVVDSTSRPDISYWGLSNNLAGSILNPSPSLIMDSNGPARIPSTSSASLSASTTTASNANRTNKINYRFIFITTFIHLLLTCIVY